MSGIFLGPIAFEVLVVVLTITKAYHEAVSLRDESEEPIVRSPSTVVGSPVTEPMLAKAVHLGSGWVIVRTSVDSPFVN